MHIGILLLLVTLASSYSSALFPRYGYMKKQHLATSPSSSSSSLMMMAASTEAVEDKSCFIFGLGYVGAALADALVQDGWTVSGTSTNVPKIQSLRGKGIKAYLFDDEAGKMVQPEALDDLISSSYILSTIAPTTLGQHNDKDAVLFEHATDLKRAALGGKLRWVGYISSTGVYGDRDGAWVSENDDIRPENEKTRNRADAEQAWRTLGSRSGIPMHIFRVAGIYGPGRSAIDTVTKYNGDLEACGGDDKQFISRIHVADIVNTLKCSMLHPNPGSIYNVADDLPSTRYEVLSYACKLLQYPISSPQDGSGSSDRGRYRVAGRENGVRGGSKRVDNTRLQRLVEIAGSSLQYPDYRAGLQAIFTGSDKDTKPNDTFQTGLIVDEDQEEIFSSDPLPGGGRGREASRVDTLQKRVTILESQLAQVMAKLEKLP